MGKIREGRKVKLNSPDFINIVRLGDSELQIVLRLTDNRSLEQALSLAPPIALERVKACLSMRAGIMLEEAIETKPVDVESAVIAQTKMATILTEVLRAREPNAEFPFEKLTYIDSALGTLFSELAVILSEQDLGPHKEHLYALKLAVQHHLLTSPLKLNEDFIFQECSRLTTAYLKGSIEHSDISQGLKSNAEEILQALLMIHARLEKEKNAA